MFKTLFSQEELIGSSPLSIPIMTNGCSVKIENQSMFALDVFVGTEQVKRINPYSYQSLPNAEYTVKVNKQIKATNEQPYNYIAYETINGTIQQETGSTNFTGTMNVAGDVNVEGTVNVDGVVNVAGDVGINGDVSVIGDVNATITNAEINATITNAEIPVRGSVDATITNAQIPVSGDVNATITGGTVNIGGGTVQAEITSGSVNATIQNAQISTEIVNTAIPTNDMVLLGSTSITYNFNATAGYITGITVGGVSQRPFGIFDTILVLAKTTRLPQQNGSPNYYLSANAYFGKIQYTDITQGSTVASLGANDPQDLMITSTLSLEKPISQVNVMIEAVSKTGTWSDTIQIEVYAYNSGFNPKVKGVEGKFFKATGNQFFTSGVGGVDLQNADIIGVNGIVLGDYAQSDGEGILFPKSTAPTRSTTQSDYETLRGLDGTLYFGGVPAYEKMATGYPNADANTFTNNGLYYIYGTSVLNIPSVSKSGFLTMKSRTIDYAVQYWETVTGTFEVYVRRKSAGTWSAWVKIV